MDSSSRPAPSIGRFSLHEQTHSSSMIKWLGRAESWKRIGGRHGFGARHLEPGHDVGRWLPAYVRAMDVMDLSY